MQRKDLALRVLSTAAIMSIVTSIAAPAFADIYYIGNGSIDVVTKADENGNKYVEVKQGDKTYTDTSKEIVIKDGTSEKDATLKEISRDKDKRAEAAVPDNERTATQELEAAGSADAAGSAAGESQPDPDDAFNLSEEEEDSEEGKDPTDNPTDNPAANPTDDPTANTKKDVVFELDPAADPEPEQQATKLAPTTSATPTAKTQEVTLDDAPAATPTTPTAPAADPPAEGSADNPSKNVIRVINDWVGKVLNIRLSNVNIKPDSTSSYADGTKGAVYNKYHTGYYGVSSAEVQGTGNTKIELDGQNVLDNSVVHNWAGLRKMDSGNLTITDETSDKGETITAKEETETSGSLRAEGAYYGGAAIGGSWGQATDNITIEGYATVKANTLEHDGAGIGGGNGAKGSNITIQGHANVTANGGLSGAGIGGGGRADDGGGDAENITIQDYAKVTAIGQEGAAIGSGSSWSSDKKKKNGDAKKIVICGHATVNATNSHDGAAIGAAGYGTGASAEVMIGTAGAAAEKEDVHVTATSKYGSAIGNGTIDTKVTIQGRATIQTASSRNDTAIGSGAGDVTVNITDNVAIDTDDETIKKDSDYSGSGIGGGYISHNSGRTVEVNIDGGKDGKVKLGENSAITAGEGAISGTKVTIGNNVLLKMKHRGLPGNRYIAVNDAEAEVGKRNNPTAGGLVNTIGDNTQLWYTDFKGVLQKIVHGKNVCKKEPGDLKEHQDATCGKDGYNKYQCGYEHAHDAENPSCDLTWQEVLKATGNHQHTEIRNKKDATCTEKGYTGDTWCTDCNSEIAKGTETPVLGHNFHGTENVTKAATCTTAGVKLVKCTRCNEFESQIIPATGHNYQDDWTVTTPATCTDPGVETRYCHNDHNHSETRPTALNGSNHGNYKTHIEGYVAPTCTKDGYTGDTYCDGCHQKIKDGKVIPATGHHWVDNGDGTHGCSNPGCGEKHSHSWVDKGDGTHTCPDCGATEALPSNTNSALELRVVDAEGMDQPFTVSQNGTLRTYTGAYDTATLTGDLDTLRYLQDHGAQTIQFVTNGQTSSFAINDLLAQGSGSEVFYLTHRGAEEPTLLLVEADHSELVKD